MSGIDITALLGGWEGCEVVDVERIAGAVPEVWITLGPLDAGLPVCDGCGGVASEVHEVVWRRVRDPDYTVPS